MFDWFRQQVLLVMRVPHDPAPPFGAPGSTRVFRAGRKYLHLRLLGWGFTQMFLLAGIIFWAVVLHDVEITARTQKATRGSVPPLTSENFVASMSAISTQPAGTAAKNKSPKRNNYRLNGWENFKQGLVEVALRLPDWAFPVIWFFKFTGFAFYLAQIPFTFALRRLDYELRWYIVTDRSLRIRTGLIRLQESTMSFANLQQVEVKQDPIQRILGLADVHVQSAGGGGDQEHGKGKMGDSLHTGIFHSVDNATEIRDLILERLRRFRQAGLGDPDDHHDLSAGGGVPSPREASATNCGDTLAAAREVLAEAKALRATLAS